MTDLPINIQRFFQDGARGLPKRDRTRGIILDAVIETVSTQGLESTAVRGIIQIAGISHGTFYNHFESREAAIIEATSKIAAELDRAAQQGGDLVSPPDEQLIMGTMRFIELASRRKAWGKMLVETISPLDGLPLSSSKNFRKVLSGGVAAGVFSVPITPLLTRQIGAIIALCIGLRMESRSSPQILQDTCSAILRLLGVPAKTAEKRVHEMMANLPK